MRKILFLLMLVCVPLHAEEGVETIAGFDDKSDLPVLNNEIRKLDEKNQDIDARVVTLEDDPGLSAASQAEQETGTSTTVYVSPGRQKYNASAAKAWCIFSGATVGTNAPTAGYNVSTVQRHSTGVYTITFTVAFSSASYVVSGAANKSNGNLATIGINTLAAGTCKINLYDADGVVDDADPITVVFFGDQ